MQTWNFPWKHDFQTRLIVEPKIPISNSWERHIDRSVRKTTSVTFPSKNSKNSASIKMSADANKFHQTKEYRYFLRGVMAEWLRRWTWNPMKASRACRNSALSVRSHFSETHYGKVGNRNQYLCSQYGLSAILKQRDWRWHSTAKIRTLLQSSLRLQTQWNFKQKTVNIFPVSSDFWVTRA